jgi:DNA-binding NtrC family response regulator
MSNAVHGWAGASAADALEPSDVPVILLTGHASMSRVRGMSSAFDYLMKPVDLDGLLDTVRRPRESASGTQSCRRLKYLLTYGRCAVLISCVRPDSAIRMGIAGSIANRDAIVRA